MLSIRDLTSGSFNSFTISTRPRIGATSAVDLKSNRVKQIIDEDMSEFQNFGFTGTPVVILNGIALKGAQPLEELERMLKLTTN